MRLRDCGIVFDTRVAPDNQRSTSATSVVVAADGTVYVTCRLGTDREGPDGHTAVFASTDVGGSWELRYLEARQQRWDGVLGETRGWYLAELEPGVLTASVLWVDRSEPDLPWVNPATQGLLPLRTYLLRSSDGGRTWHDRRPIDPGGRPGASPTGPMLRLEDGTLAQPMESWKEYDDPAPGRPAAWLRLAPDGERWIEEVVVAQDPDNRIFYWDQRLARLPSGGFVAMFWTHEPGAGRDRDNHISWGDASGRWWTEPRGTGLPGQHCQPVALPDGTLLAVYAQRTGAAGIHVARSEDLGQSWDHDGALPIYASDAGREPGTGTPRSPEEYWNDMGSWQFGHPRAAMLANGELLVAFYGGHGNTRPLRAARVQL